MTRHAHLTLTSLLLFSLHAPAAVSANHQLPVCSGEFTPAPGSYEFIEAPADGHDIPDGATIGAIHYTRLPIFDESNPRENNALFRWANRFHILTRKRTVARNLLFDEGDTFDARVIQESARILRDADYLYDAAIRPVNRCDREVDVEVITRDVWSFTPEVSYDRSGGDNSFRFGIAETNLFGTGRELSFAVIKDPVRRSTRFIYEDDNVGGNRRRVNLLFADSDDGLHQYAAFSLPFYSLDSRRAWRVSFDKVKRDDSQYFRGDEVTATRHEIEEYIVSYGWSAGLKKGRTNRWRLGYIYRDDRFSETVLPPPAEFPTDKEFSYPFVEFTSLEDNYSTSFNLDQIHRTEDLHLGHELYMRLGYAAEQFGSDENRMLFRGTYRNTLAFSRRTLLQHDLYTDALWNLDSDASEDVVVNYQLRYFRAQTTHRSFYAKFDATYTKNLNSNRQVVLGGLTGARAFDNHFQIGDRSVLLTLEERQYTDVHFLNLIRLGFALFVDVGRAWAPGLDDGIEDSLLADVGFGIRLASSKAAVGNIVHIDFAFPLTNRDDPAVDSPQIAVNIKDSF